MPPPPSHSHTHTYPEMDAICGYLFKGTVLKLGHLLCLHFLSITHFSLFFIFLLLFSCLPLVQVCRGFVRTLKWWLVFSPTDSGDCAGPLWLQPSWRCVYFFAGLITFLIIRWLRLFVICQFCYFGFKSIYLLYRKSRVDPLSLKAKAISSFLALSCHQFSSCLWLPLHYIWKSVGPDYQADIFRPQGWGWHRFYLF